MNKNRNLCSVFLSKKKNVHDKVTSFYSVKMTVTVRDIFCNYRKKVSH